MKNKGFPLMYPIFYVILAFGLTILGFAEQKISYLISSSIIYIVAFLWLFRITKQTKK